MPRPAVIALAATGSWTLDCAAAQHEEPDRGDHRQEQDEKSMKSNASQALTVWSPTRPNHG